MGLVMGLGSKNYVNFACPYKWFVNNFSSARCSFLILVTCVSHITNTTHMGTSKA